VVPELFIKYSN